jgi:hypothetical protein
MIATDCRMSYVMNFVYMTCNTGEVTRPFSCISRGVIWVKYFLHFLVWFLLWVLFESAGVNEVILVWQVTSQQALNIDSKLIQCWFSMLIQCWNYVRFWKFVSTLKTKRWFNIENQCWINVESILIQCFINIISTNNWSWIHVDFRVNTYLSHIFNIE